ncbi:hypothetical protein QQZ08_008519 [Neonectria magnoliae]|uniref:Uncharacterized protein n=1 Tax=Neonectria magnoliae TaxID=2732573 RepID=A0ABR1HVJ1_9HYPO
MTPLEPCSLEYERLAGVPDQDTFHAAVSPQEPLDFAMLESSRSARMDLLVEGVLSQVLNEEPTFAVRCAVEHLLILLKERWRLSFNEPQNRTETGDLIMITYRKKPLFSVAGVHGMEVDGRVLVRSADEGILVLGFESYSARWVARKMIALDYEEIRFEPTRGRGGPLQLKLEAQAAWLNVPH